MPLYYGDELMVTCVHGHIRYLGESVTRFFEISVQVATPNEGHISSHLIYMNLTLYAQLLPIHHPSPPPPLPPDTQREERKRNNNLNSEADLLEYKMERIKLFPHLLSLPGLPGRMACAGVSCSGSVMAMFKDKTFTCI